MAQVIMIVGGGVWFMKRNDEVPIFISGILLYCTGYRFWVVMNEIRDWVRVSGYDFAKITQDIAVSSYGYIVLGEICLLLAYMYRQKHVIRNVSQVVDPTLLNWMRPRILILSLTLIPMVLWARANVEAQVDAGRYLSTEVSSYVYLLPMALVGISILNISLWKSGGLPTHSYKLATTLVIASITYLTFGAALRFQFLGWIVGAGIIISSNVSRKKRLAILISTTIICLGLFALAGSMRDEREIDATGGYSALERFLSAEDANMLDGFIILRNVYPEYLEYSLGRDHLEILIRPIPRSLWPGKPLGGYANRLELNNYSIGTTGISPTLFGSFYAEGGLLAIVILSIIYGIGFASISSYSLKFQPFASAIIRGVLAAAIIPLIRGGDLAGIYAWIGMAFWPCFLFLWLKRDILKLPPLSSDHSAKATSLILSPPL